MLDSCYHSHVGKRDAENPRNVTVTGPYYWSLLLVLITGPYYWSLLLITGTVAGPYYTGSFMACSLYSVMSSIPVYYCTKSFCNIACSYYVLLL